MLLTLMYIGDVSHHLKTHYQHSGSYDVNNGPKKILAWNLCFIFIYIPTAILGTSLSIPPGNVTPIFPAAGLAFAAYLILGSSILPGIFLGSFIGNLVSILRHSFDLTAFSATFIIGIGEVLASVLATFILLRYMKAEASLNTPRNLLIFFTISLFWLVSPSIGVTSLAVHGLIEWNNYWYTWLTWWLGDAIGIMLITPAILLARSATPKRLHVYNIKTTLPLILVYALFISALNLTKWPVIFLLIPATLLLVLKFEMFGAAIGSILAGTLIVGILLSGGALYEDYDLNHRLLLVQLLIGVNSFTAYFLAAHVRTIIRLGRIFIEAKQESETDPLTGLLNRRGLENHAAKTLHQTRQGDNGQTLIILDLDNFKYINDTYGHNTGDRVLVAFANSLHNLLRRNDIAARIGGEEFVLLIGTVHKSEQQAICQRVLQMTKTISFSDISADFNLTVSGGLADTTEANELKGLITLADNRLYHAKNSGKNQIIYTRDQQSVKIGQSHQEQG